MIASILENSWSDFDGGRRRRRIAFFFREVNLFSELGSDASSWNYTHFLRYHPYHTIGMEESFYQGTYMRRVSSHFSGETTLRRVLLSFSVFRIDRGIVAERSRDWTSVHEVTSKDGFHVFAFCKARDSVARSVRIGENFEEEEREKKFLVPHLVCVRTLV